ncbi:1,6-anhydro-N-acetylmuramyl-L-alanine amidase AmpD [Aquabacterium sp.]|uniref:1,6-anhydro-N-acetylmuramyl-L-alanine amidase AmpD n=1 Tax=Aquabacterium sp. TaxID=1872578 RepID=UPI002BF8BC63|nr:1,6-anhydro-N-acetylmuramyl-L-alanine amidase AmpD [Aquabacterium sp.]HSW06128.1 1,6-anhydro-N-acetylmuramyl-L-alanine amidase AmpD [Aquabacterium sp.]
MGATSAAWQAGWWHHARRCESPNQGLRPQGLAIDLVVLHSISLPPGEFGGVAIEQLFTNRLDPAAHPSFAELRGLEVSAHFVIRRDGELVQYVSTERRAWHAGRSQWGGRDNCNDFSIGIELEGLEGGLFEPAQYSVLVTLLRALRRQHPITQVVGHEHVAPGRKHDPGPGFDWAGLRRRLRWPRQCFPPDTGSPVA